MAFSQNLAHTICILLPGFLPQALRYLNASIVATLSAYRLHSFAKFSASNSPICCPVCGSHGATFGRSYGKTRWKVLALRALDSPACTFKGEDAIEEPLCLSTFIAGVCRRVAGMSLVTVLFGIHMSVAEFAPFTMLGERINNSDTQEHYLMAAAWALSRETWNGPWAVKKALVSLLDRLPGVQVSCATLKINSVTGRCATSKRTQGCLSLDGLRPKFI